MDVCQQADISYDALGVTRCFPRQSKRVASKVHSRQVSAATCAAAS